MFVIALFSDVVGVPPLFMAQGEAEHSFEPDLDGAIKFTSADEAAQVSSWVAKNSLALAFSNSKLAVWELGAATAESAKYVDYVETYQPDNG